jgi:hypothetical protein
MKNIAENHALLEHVLTNAHIIAEVCKMDFVIILIKLAFVTQDLNYSLILVNLIINHAFLAKVIYI